MSPASTCITGIRELWTVGSEPGSGRTIRDAAIIIEGDRFAWVGPAAEAGSADAVVDAGGRAAIPGWVDSHTHLIFDGDRADEFAARLDGQAYAAGGINVTVNATNSASDERLRTNIRGRLRDAWLGGTTALETKTGYALSLDGELRSAELAAELYRAGNLEAVTFLGAHLVPDNPAYRDNPDAYVDLVVGEMLAAVRPHVQWMDVFCERGAFNAAQTRRVLEAGRDAGLGLRVHGNQIGPGEGVALAVEYGAASVDHCNFMSDADIDALANSDTVATVLPACDLSTRVQFAPARKLLDAGATVAIASNCNPGTSYTTSMQYCVATAVLQMGLSVPEAVRAATWGGARALRREEARDGLPALGAVEVGHRADLQLLDAPSPTHLAYRPGMPLTHSVWRAGERVVAGRCLTGL